MRRSVSEFDLSRCYRVSEPPGGSWIVRCKFCTAGWLPAPTSPVKPLIRHARKHRRRLRLILPPTSTIAAAGDGARQTKSSASRLVHVMKIPEGAKVVHDERLSLIRAVTMLNEHVDGAGGVKDQVRAAMVAQGAQYASDDRTLARLHESSRYVVDPTKLYALVQKGMLTMKQFLGAVSVRREALKDVLGGKAIDKLSERIAGRASLCTEFKAGVDGAAIAAELVKTLEAAFAAKSPAP